MQWPLTFVIKVNFQFLMSKLIQKLQSTSHVGFKHTAESLLVYLLFSAADPVPVCEIRKAKCPFTLDVAKISKSQSF